MDGTQEAAGQTPKEEVVEVKKTMVVAEGAPRFPSQEAVVVVAPSWFTARGSR